MTEELRSSDGRAGLRGKCSVECTAEALTLCEGAVPATEDVEPCVRGGEDEPARAGLWGARRGSVPQQSHVRRPSGWAFPVVNERRRQAVVFPNRGIVEVPSECGEEVDDRLRIESIPY